MKPSWILASVIPGLVLFHGSEVRADEHQKREKAAQPEPYGFEYHVEEKRHDVHPLAMPDLTSKSALSVEVGYMQIDRLPSVERVPGFEDIEALGRGLDVFNAEIAGQLEVAPNMYLFGNVPIAHLRHFEDPGFEAKSDIGNVSGGVRYIGGKGRLLGGVSVAASLPTAPELGEGEGEAAVLASLARFDRFGSYLPDTSAMYAHGHVRVAFDRGFIQGLVGYERYTLGLDESMHHHLRTGISAGIQASERVALIGEWTGLSYVLEGGDRGPFRESISNETDSWVHVGARFSGEQTDVGARVTVPLMSPLGTERDEIGFIIDMRQHY